MSKTQLAVLLSRCENFEKPKNRLEQYPTDSEVAADLLWNAYMLGDIENKRLVDLGAGTGILSLGALLLGAKEVTLIEKDPDALKIAQKNLKSESSWHLIEQDIQKATGEFDTVIQNPPFGCQNKHADRPFLSKACELATVVYSLHSAESQTFLQRFVKELGFEITHIWNYQFPIKKSRHFHKRQIQRIPVIGVRLRKTF
ncbi:MAG: METTL5 family protein [Nanobdellota archaeon]